MLTGYHIFFSLVGLFLFLSTPLLDFGNGLIYTNRQNKTNVTWHGVGREGNRTDLVCVCVFVCVSVLVGLLSTFTLLGKETESLIITSCIIQSFKQKRRIYQRNRVTNGFIVQSNVGYREKHRYDLGDIVNEIQDGNGYFTPTLSRYLMTMLI